MTQKYLINQGKLVFFGFKAKTKQLFLSMQFMCSISSTVNSVESPLYRVQYTVYNLQCTVYIVHFTVYSVQLVNRQILTLIPFMEEDELRHSVLALYSYILQTVQCTNIHQEHYLVRLFQSPDYWKVSFILSWDFQSIGPLGRCFL